MRSKCVECTWVNETRTTASHRPHNVIDLCEMNDIRDEWMWTPREWFRPKIAFNWLTRMGHVYPRSVSRALSVGYGRTNGRLDSSMASHAAGLLIGKQWTLNDNRADYALPSNRSKSNRLERTNHSHSSSFARFMHVMISMSYCGDPPEQSMPLAWPESSHKHQMQPIDRRQIHFGGRCELIVGIGSMLWIKIGIQCIQRSPFICYNWRKWQTTTARHLKRNTMPKNCSPFFGCSLSTRSSNMPMRVDIFSSCSLFDSSWNHLFNERTIQVAAMSRVKKRRRHTQSISHNGGITAPSKRT